MFRQEKWHVEPPQRRLEILALLPLQERLEVSSRDASRHPPDVAVDELVVVGALREVGEHTGVASVVGPRHLAPSRPELRG